MDFLLLCVMSVQDMSNHSSAQFLSPLELSNVCLFSKTPSIPSFIHMRLSGR